MSDVRAVNQAVSNDLQRRRQLKGMTKPELIDWVVQLETNAKRTQDSIDALKDRIRTAYEEGL
ncbi:hypothetical protein [Microbacterium sp. TPD7012]|uniref:hypothetical protein n=1 Tax=Microbacterium sp. TPD7012 TaxID=2171975 RepID=UPI000D5110D7|nr:hypothetical protein [Microbacterium sp. TPD7012]PVE95002.1 hypothetical protein DC434_13840 [Microbacterium sp. TPD7012]